MKTTLANIASEITKMVTSSGIYTSRPIHGLSDMDKWEQNIPLGNWASSASFEFEQAWGLGASLYIRNVRVVIKGVKAPTFTFDVSVNSSAMNDDLNAMYAKIALLRRVVELGSQIQTVFNGCQIEITPEMQAALEKADKS
jgi:hypothetical protein